MGSNARGFFKIDPLVLDVKEVTYRYGIPRMLLENMSVSTRMDYELDQMVITLHKKLYAHELPPEHISDSTVVTFESPATWFDAWKLACSNGPDLVLRWFSRKFPPKFTTEQHKVTLTVNCERWQTLPDASWAIPEDKFGPVYVRAYTENIWKDEIVRERAN